ncbi:MAG: TRAP transporter small permease [Rhodospirillaceae bacterium]|nr:TRAP transporter small permease [Rhodospirillaceae bacterium]
MPKLARILTACENAGALVATLIFVAMMLVVCSEVLLRYGFNSPISWVVEISEYALLWITFLGAAWVLRADGHVRVDIVLQFLSPNALRACGMITAAFGALTTAVICGFGIHATWSAYVQGAFKPTGTDVPTWMIIIVIPLGALLLFFRFLRFFVEYYSRQRSFGGETAH